MDKIISFFKSCASAIKNFILTGVNQVYVYCLDKIESFLTKVISVVSAVTECLINEATKLVNLINELLTEK